MQNSKNKKRSLKKDKKLIKLINNSDSEDDSEHELSYYMNDRVKLMKQVLKIIKPNKIKSMAPDCLQVKLYPLTTHFTRILRLFLCRDTITKK